jgi:phosphatidylinositol kinase/protein kinase (PI-3  family)
MTIFFLFFRPDKSNVMDSKMRPILIVAENMCPFGNDFVMIFKKGDDLRQDMLILQMIKIFDTIWKDGGHDFRMNPYGCISMECKLGLIEVVTQAETIANIQKAYHKASFSTFDKSSLLRWLGEKNPDEFKRKQAIQEFTYSCAGYCVATYVLGVADRHSDNIMLRENGQLFHIDYGHILGNFKEKWGIRRERVPFVLTADFVHVITGGSKSERKNPNFEQFVELCEDVSKLIDKLNAVKIFKL